MLSVKELYGKQHLHQAIHMLTNELHNYKTLSSLGKFEHVEGLYRKQRLP